MTAYEEDDYYPDEQPKSAPRGLREHNDQLKQENAEMRDRLAKLETTNRQRVIAETLSRRGLNPGIAEFVPSSIEATEESVTAWVTEKASVFGLQVAPPPQERQPQQQADPFRRMAAVEQGGQPTIGMDALAQVEAAQNEEELFAMLHGGLNP